MTNTESRRRHGFRPLPRRRARLAIGLALCAVAVGGNVLVYSSLGDTAQVVQLTTDVRAGERVEAGDLRLVEAALDPTVPSVGASQMSSIVGQYARVHLVSGSLISAGVVQPAPLVSPDSTVVAVEVRPTRIPTGLRERSRVLVIVPQGAEVAPLIVEGRVVAHSDDGGDAVDTDRVSLEVALDSAAAIAAADDVRLVLLDPGVDPALEPGAG